MGIRCFRKILVLLCLGLVLGISGVMACDVVLADSPTGTIIVTVRDDLGNPVPYAVLGQAISLTMNTHLGADAQGRLVLQVPANVPQSPICAVYQRVGSYVTSGACTAALTVASGANLSVDLVLLPSGSATPTATPQSSGSIVAPTVVAPTPTGTSPSSTSSPCQFILGFKTLHNLLTTVVGDCADDESHNPANGDGLQHTTKGLLVWRKADNVTAFTDGYHTWVNGPQGVQERLNTQRFPWEANPDGMPVAP